MGDSETKTALKRAAARAGFHLLKAAVESLKAVEAVIDELGSIGHERPAPPPPPEPRPDPVRIDIE